MKLKLKHNNSTYSVTDDSVRDGQIKAITDVYGTKNLSPTKDIGGTQAGLTVTMNSDGSITFHAGTSTNTSNVFIYLGSVRLMAGEYYYSGGLPTSFNDKIALLNHAYGPINDSDQLFAADGSRNYSMIILIYPQITLSQDVTFYPMIRDARITDSTYVPYSMTNYQLTERVQNIVFDKIFENASGNVTANDIQFMNRFMGGQYHAYLIIWVSNYPPNDSGAWLFMQSPIPGQSIASPIISERYVTIASVDLDNNSITFNQSSGNIDTVRITIIQIS